MKVNWKVRIANKMFWVTAIPALLLVIQLIANLFGFSLDLGEVGNKLISLANAAFALLSVLGIVNDPTTKGMSDSERAMTYEKPKE